MGEPFIGTEALGAGRLTPHRLRSHYDRIHRDVYLQRGSELTAAARAKAAWLWSGRVGVVAGQSAASVHGAKWVDATAPAEVLYPNRRPPVGIRTWSDRYAADEVERLGGVVVTTPARTALDIACRYPLADAVAAVDALARATGLKIADVKLLAERYRGRRGIRAAFEVMELVDPGAESPQETRVRLLLIEAGFPRPETQIPVLDEYGEVVAVLDMGWRAIKVGVDYDGKHHRMSRGQFNRDIRRFEAITESGWDDVRVTAEDTDGSIIGRVRRAFDRRT